MSDHPDQAFAAYILCRIEKGFRIGFNPQLVSLQSSGANLCSAPEQSEVVEKYLLEELAACPIVCVQDADADLIHCSLFGMIPKRNRPNKINS